jgi:hypothetical protein
MMAKIHAATVCVGPVSLPRDDNAALTVNLLADGKELGKVSFSGANVYFEQPGKPVKHWSLTR